MGNAQSGGGAPGGAPTPSSPPPSTGAPAPPPCTLLAIRGDRFGLRNIAKGTAVADLRRVFVPVYLFHRYQVDAVVKQVGGVDYGYAVSGGGHGTEIALRQTECLSQRFPQHRGQYFA